MRRQKSLIASLLTVVLSFGALAQRQQSATSPISINTLRAHIKFLSDDRLEGRGTGAKGGETAALYIAEQFEAIGLKGAGPKGSFWQQVSLVGVKADPKTELRINGPTKAEAFKFADEFVAFTGAQTERVSVNTDLIFVGSVRNLQILEFHPRRFEPAGAGGVSCFGPKPSTMSDSALILPVDSMFCSDWNRFSPSTDAWFHNPLASSGFRYPLAASAL